MSKRYCITATTPPNVHSVPSSQPFPIAIPTSALGTLISHVLDLEAVWRSRRRASLHDRAAGLWRQSYVRFSVGRIWTANARKVRSDQNQAIGDIEMVQGAVKQLESGDGWKGLVMAHPLCLRPRPSAYAGRMAPRGQLRTLGGS